MEDKKTKYNLHTELRKFGYTVDQRWSVDTLKKKIAEAQEKAWQKEQQEAERMRKLQWEQKQRERVINSRGTIGNLTESAQKNFGLRYIDRTIEAHKQYFQENLDKFYKDAQNSPRYAMEWSDGLYADAAKFEVAETVQQMFDDGQPIKEIRQAVMNTMINKSRYVSKSTSVSSNRMHQELIAAMADWVEKLQMEE